MIAATALFLQFGFSLAKTIHFFDFILAKANLFLFSMTVAARCPNRPAKRDQDLQKPRFNMKSMHTIVVVVFFFLDLSFVV